MRSPLADHQAFNGRPANRAGFPLPSIYSKMILELTPAIYPIDAGPIAADAFTQGRADGSQ